MADGRGLLSPRRRRGRALTGSIWWAAAAPLAAAGPCGVCNPEEHVNTLGGTNSTPDESNGNVLPLVVRPWGMNAWSPATSRSAYQDKFWFHPSQTTFYGVRCTHQPSPWIGDYGQFWIVPSVEDITEEEATDSRLGWDTWPTARLNVGGGTWKPYLWEATLSDLTEADMAKLRRSVAPWSSFPGSDSSNGYGRYGPGLPGSADVVKTKAALRNSSRDVSTATTTTRTTTTTTLTTTTTSYPPSPSQDGITLALTATQRAAAMDVVFPPVAQKYWSHQRYRLEVLLNNGAGASINASIRHDGRPVLSGWTKHHKGGVLQQCRKAVCEDMFSHWFYLTVESSAGGSLHREAVTLRQQSKYRASIDIDPEVCGQKECRLLIRVGTSFVSAEQAELNFEREADGRPFEALVSEAKMEWRDVLGRVDVLDFGDGYNEEEQNGLLEVLYSSLYRATQFPRLLHEVSNTGGSVHYSPYDPSGRVLPGFVATDSGFWDSYRTVYPLLSLLYPEKLGQLVQGFVAAWEESGWLPKWPSPGERGNMEGTLGDAVLADAIAKGIGGFNRTAAYAAIRQDAFVVPNLTTRKHRWDPEPMAHGRSALKGYLHFGYVPDGSRDAKNSTVVDVVSRTLDYLLADKAIAHAADALGFADDAKALHLRAANYSRLFDASTGFLRAPGLNGSFAFDPHWNTSRRRVVDCGGLHGCGGLHVFEDAGRARESNEGQYAWGNPYAEGGPWQYRFSVPWDPKGLAALFREAGLDMCDELERMMTGPSHYGFYGGTESIHEQTEMKSHCWGQYAHNNQPVHHVLYMFAASEGTLNGRCASRGQRWIRKALLELYNPGSAMYSGDEDNGEMGAWFVLSALGLYQLEPGNPGYALGSPLFGRVALRPQGRKELQIVAEGNSRDNPYVEAAFFEHEPGGKPPAELAGPQVQYAALAGGGELRFQMSREPGARAKLAGGAPGLPAQAQARRRRRPAAVLPGTSALDQAQTREEASRTAAALAPAATALALAAAALAAWLAVLARAGRWRQGPQHVQSLGADGLHDAATARGDTLFVPLAAGAVAAEMAQEAGSPGCGAPTACLV